MIKNLFVGIDPQPTLIAICAMNLPELHIKDWSINFLYRKDKMRNAEEWQIYLCDKIKLLLNELINTSGYKPINIFLGIEQQRGRINSIIEQTILCTGKELGMNVSVFHPGTWRKHLKEIVTPQGSNAKNKINSEELIKHKWYDYSKDISGNRIHDACDAYLICVANILSKYPELYTVFKKAILKQ